MNVNLEDLIKRIDKHTVTVVPNQNGENYIWMIVQNEFSIEDIDFSQFDHEDLELAMTSLEEAITDEDTRGQLYLDPKHPYTRMIELRYKFKFFENMNKQTLPSKYRFI